MSTADSTYVDNTPALTTRQRRRWAAESINKLPLMQNFQPNPTQRKHYVAASLVDPTHLPTHALTQSTHPCYRTPTKPNQAWPSQPNSTQPNPIQPASKPQRIISITRNKTNRIISNQTKPNGTKHPLQYLNANRGKIPISTYPNPKPKRRTKPKPPAMSMDQARHDSFPTQPKRQTKRKTKPNTHKT